MKPTARRSRRRPAKAPLDREAPCIQAAARQVREGQGRVPGPVKRRLEGGKNPRRETMKTNAAAAEREADADPVAERNPLADLRNLPQRAANEDRRCTPS